jgi:hypothetical protein
MKRWLQYALVTLAGLAPFALAAEPAYVGVKTCTKCHDVQGESWEGTAHAKAFDSLTPNTKAEAKTKAKLDPAKDYTKDKDCLGCHSTGFGQSGGYEIGMAPGGAKALGSVGCESCHGAGGGYRDEHGAAEKLLKKESKKTARKTLADRGQNFDYARACADCHLNYPGSPHKDAKPPFTPFTPTIDAKYGFDFDKAVRGKALHEHYKLKGVFDGPPVPPVRGDLQKNAKEIPE